MRSRQPWRVVAAVTCCVAAVALADTSRPGVPDTIGQRLLACTTCHGKEGVANPQAYFPRIAGKPSGYLYNQLLNFRDGRRNNATMAALIANMSDTYLMEIAAYFAALDLPYAPPVVLLTDDPALARGRLLVERGDEATRVPACTRCHGAAMTGVSPYVPGLLGLRKDYLLAQFGAWRTGERRAAAPDCMQQISRRLSATDLGAVAAYLSQQAVPTPSSAANGVKMPLPIECGSMPK